MGAKNTVIAGDYERYRIEKSFSDIWLQKYLTKVQITKDTVEEYEVIEESSKKSVVSAVGRAFVGGAILGPVGWFAGITAKSKGTHVVAIQFKDGKKSLLELDDKNYSALMKRLF